MAQLSSFPLHRSWYLALGFTLAFVACVSDDPANNVFVTGDDGGTGAAPGVSDGGATTGVPSGTGGVDAAGTDSAAEPPPAKGDFAWLTTLDVTSQPAVAANADGVVAIAVAVNSSQIMFGGQPCPGTPGASAIAVAAFNPDGSPRFTSCNPSSASFIGNVWSAAVDDAGYVYVAGTTSTDVFGFTSPGGFVVQLDKATGGKNWSRVFSSTQTQACYVAAQGTTELAVACSFQGALGYRLLDVNGAEKDAVFDAGPSAIASAVLDLRTRDGAASWSRMLGAQDPPDAGYNVTQVQAVAFAGGGRVVVGGVSNVPTLTDDLNVGRAVQKSPGVYDSFVAKIDTGLHRLLWVNRYATAAPTSSRGVFAIAGTPEAGAVVCGGFTSAAVNFGAGQASSSGNDDAFAFAVDTSGTTQWQLTYGGSAEDDCRGVRVDSYGNVLLTGTHRSGGVTVGPAGKTLPLAEPPPGGGAASHTVKLLASGQPLWARTATSAAMSGNVFTTGVATDHAGNVYTAGNFAGITTFGDPAHPMGTAPTGGSAVYLLKRTP